MNTKDSVYCVLMVAVMLFAAPTVFRVFVDAGMRLGSGNMDDPAMRDLARWGEVIMTYVVPTFVVAVLLSAALFYLVMPEEGTDGGAAAGGVAGGDPTGEDVDAACARQAQKLQKEGTWEDGKA